MTREQASGSEAAQLGLPAPSIGRRLLGVDGVRGLAAFTVLVAHVYQSSDRSTVDAYPWVLEHGLPFMTASLTLFFTISAFLLYRPFVAAAVRRKPVDHRAYFANRGLRIFPAYWVVLILAGIFLGTLAVPAGVDGAERAPGGLQDPSVVVQQMTMLFQFHRSTAFTGVPPAWSLAVEICFYIALPFLGWLAWRLVARRRRNWSRKAALLAPAVLLFTFGLVGMGIAAATPIGVGGDFGSNWGAILYRSFLPLSAWFLGGMTLAVLRVELEEGRLKLPKRWRGMTIATGIAAVLISDQQITHGGTYHEQQITLMLACTCLLSLVVLDTPQSRSVRFFEGRAITWFGVVSYSVFLWHMPVTAWLHEHGLFTNGWAGFPLNVALVAAITAVLAGLTYRFVEKPALERKRRPKRKTGPEPALEPA